MANTYTQLYIQFVFAVENREALIKESIRDEVQKYLTGIAQNKGHKMLAVYCNPDHTHVFLGLKPEQSISSLANDLKVNTSKWLNERGLCKHKFNWQAGFGAFSYHRSMLSTIGNYVNNQKEHHKKRSFKDEYLDLLHEFDIAFEDQYLFNFFDCDTQ